MLASTRLAFRVWARETSALLGLTPRVFKGIGLAFFVIAITLMIGATQLFGDLSRVINESGPEDAVLVVRSLGSGVLLSAMAIGAIFGLLTADSSAMDTLLQIAGASRAKRIAVLIAPTVAVAVGVTWLATLPIIYTLSAVGPGWSGAVALFISGAWLVTSATVFALGLHRLTSTFCRRYIHLPLVHANVSALVVVLGLGVVLGWPTFSPASNASFLRSLSPGEALHDVAVGLIEPSRASLLAGGSLLVASSVLAALAVVAGAGEVPDAGNQSNSITYTTVRPPRRGTFALLVWYEAVSLARAPTTLMSLLGVVGCGVVASIWHASTIGELFVVLVAAIAGAVGLHATGVNIGASWILWATIGQSWRLGAAKLAAAFLVALGLYGFGAVGLLITFGGPTVATVLVQFMLPTFVGSLLAGSLVPVDGQQPLTSAMAGALTLLISAGGLLLLTQLLGLFGSLISELTIPVFLVSASLGVVAVLANLHSESVVKRT